MTQDRSKKTVRQFQCRDYLWELFEQMSAELECSTDYLINEAMRQYARSRNYASSARALSQRIAAPTGSFKAQQSKSSLPPLPAQGRQSAPSGQQLSPSFPASSGPPGPAYPGRSTGQLPAVSGHPTAFPDPRSGPPPLQATYGSPQDFGQSGPAAPFGADPGASLEARRPSLYVEFQGQRYPVIKDSFVIGRGSKTTDLSIKDGNISRRHAAVVFQDGAYYVKDLGSTNGIEYRGQRIDIKRIEEGDIFNLCDYELRFTFH